MSASSRLCLSLAVALLLASSARESAAQYEDHCGPFCDAQDYQWFEPVDLDLDCKPIRFDCGWFGRYDKLMWSFTGERTTIGDKSVNVTSEQIYVNNNPLLTALDPTREFEDAGRQDIAPIPYRVQNDIQNAPPNAEFGYGDRYEMGYVDSDGTGFSIGIIHGMESDSSTVYGFGAPLNGFGSVHVNFEIPSPDFLRGFRDYGPAADLDLDDDDDNAQFPIEIVTVGPGGVIGRDFEVDNIDGDFAGGVIGIITTTPGGDPIIFFYYDFDDLHEFNIRFDQLTVRNRSQVDGFELMRTVRLDNSHYMAKNQNQQLEIGYGMRYFQFKDEFFWGGNIDGVNGWGNTFIDTDVENQLVGPQISLKWDKQVGKWNLSADTRFMFAYNVQDLDQVGAFGENIITGGFNNSAVAQPTYSASGRQDETFSPLAEFRAELKYQVTRSLAVKAGYNATFVDNITRASQVVVYRLPNFGVRPGGAQDVFINGATLGVELNY